MTLTKPGCILGPALAQDCASNSPAAAAGLAHSIPDSPASRVNSSNLKASIGSLRLPYGIRSRKRTVASPR